MRSTVKFCPGAANKAEGNGECEAIDVLDWTELTDVSSPGKDDDVVLCIVCWAVVESTPPGVAAKEVAAEDVDPGRDAELARLLLVDAGFATTVTVRRTEKRDPERDLTTTWTVNVPT